MASGHLELLRKAVEHTPTRLFLELHDSVGEVAWLIKCRHTNADVDHELFVHWSSGHEEAPPRLYPDRELPTLTGRKEIAVLPNTSALVGSMVLQHQVVRPNKRGKVVISGVWVCVGKAGTIGSAAKTRR